MLCEQVAQVREDVRAAVTLRLMKQMPTRMKECISQENVTVFMGDARCARARVANPLRERSFVRPATGTRGANCTCTLSVVGRSRVLHWRHRESDEPSRLLLGQHRKHRLRSGG